MIRHEKEVYDLFCPGVSKLQPRANYYRDGDVIKVFFFINLIVTKHRVNKSSEIFVSDLNYLSVIFTELNS